MNDVAQLLAGLVGLPAGDGVPRLVGIGWATVDIERTLADLAVATAHATDDDELLGARAWRVDGSPVALLLLEPVTEGRLAAALARRGEGIAALYLVADTPLEGSLRPTAVGVPGRLMPQERPWGPFLIRVDPGPALGLSTRRSIVPGGASNRGQVAHRPAAVG